MGCKNTKDAKQEDKKIKSDFKHIGILRYDDFFRNAEGFLSRAEELRSGVEDSKETGTEKAGTWQLKDPQYIDTAQVLFWSISANNEGKAKNAGLAITKEAPYVTLDKKKVNPDTHELYDSLETYLKTVAAGPNTVKEVVEKLQEAANKVPDLITEGKNEIQGSALDMKGKANAVMALTKNGDQLKKEAEKCKKLKDIIEQANTDMKDLLPKLKDIVEHADEVGAKAAADKLTTPLEIFNKYHTGERKEAEKKKPEEKKKEEKKKEEKKDASPTKKEEAGAKNEEAQPEKKAESPVKKEETHAEKKEEVHQEKKEEVHQEKKDEPQPHVPGQSLTTH